MRAIFIAWACLALAAQAPQRPDFSGYWVAIMEDENVIPPYLGEKLKIEHKDPAFLISTTVQDKPVTFRFSADGRAHTNQTLLSKVSTVAKWDGEALVLTSTLVGKDNARLVAKERWTLTPNGRKLGMQGYFETGKIKKNQLLEYERQ